MNKLVGIIHFAIFVVLLAAILLLSVFVYHKDRLFIIGNVLLIAAVLYNWYLFSRFVKKSK
ncbi:hypothetical protein IGK74_002141 [Enterococcus sp. AZ150]|uniref:Uncharacterized protein n=1 Tax=Enterococcus sulfureus ATCC 49903 TaxID=1140003 RepID=S0L2E2_9ENTE|nr:hypothetical protein [Enterococcus sulfureus]EOT46483.1 hypothetical protein OMY_01632 [Enterococcus sulfureus ATCC 49903]EOT86204.1 hypothetical protein I573_00957 [Enterococcus sulfureus ATCC 49903]